MKKLLFSLLFGLFIMPAFAQEGFLGEIRLFAGNFAPRGWALCEGQLLPINTNTALFSILGTQYGGDGRTSFALPKLEGPIQNPAMLLVAQTESNQTEPRVVANFVNQMKEGLAIEMINDQGIVRHMDEVAPGATSTQRSAKGTTWQVRRHNGELIARAVLTDGAEQTYNIKQPQRVNYIICLVGLFPSRN